MASEKTKELSEEDRKDILEQSQGDTKYHI